MSTVTYTNSYLRFFGFCLGTFWKTIQPNLGQLET